MEGISYTLPIVHSRLRGFFATRRAATRNAGIGALLTLGVMAAYLAGWPLFEGLELRLYDMRCKLRANLATADEIVLVAIDENSQVQLGSWPWPRWRLAGLIDKLSAAGAKVVGLDVPLSETEYSPGLAEIQHLRERYDGLLAARAVTDRKKAFAVEFSSSISQLDSDARLEESMRRAGNVVLPVLFKPRGKLAAGSDAPPLSVSSHALFCSGVGHAAGTTSAPGLTAVYPLARFASASVGLGHIQEASDFDGVLRWEMPVLRYGDAVYASFPMELVLAHGGFGDIGAQWIPGRFLRIGGHDIPTDSRGRMLITYNGPEQTFQYFSFADVMNDKTPKDAFKGKIVIVDEFTGRLMPDRTWRDGLHQAVEAKEQLTVNPPKDTFARVSFQRFFRQYRQLSGMTGTASEAKLELWQIYHRPVVVMSMTSPCVSAARTASSMDPPPWLLVARYLCEQLYHGPAGTRHRRWATRPRRPARTADGQPPAARSDALCVRFWSW